ncbi:MAG TPA: alginate export family protein [Nitrospira sp.]|nr:alginate export family protein [Nitrospira sp.]
MRSILGRTGWASLATFFSAAVMAAGLSFTAAPVQAAFELPEGEKITNLPAIPRNIPQKEAYELYDPRIGKNFDLKNFWMRADIRVRPEWRQGVCFGGSPGSLGACNSGVNAKGTGPGANNSFVQQWVRLGIGYDLSPDVNFYMETIYSNDWGTSANPAAPGAAGGPALNNNCNTVNIGQCGLGVRAAYMLIRNLGGIQGLSLKAGRQYVIFGAQSLFGHFDWANTGFSHDGFMFQYSTKPVDIFAGLFRESDLNIGQAASTGSFNNCVGAGGTSTGCQSKQNSTLGLVYTQIKSVPGFIFEPHYFLYMNGQNVTGCAGPACTPGIGSNVGVWVPKSNSQIRHTIGNRVEMRKGNFDFQNELEYQWGRMASGQNNGSNSMDLHINAWATRNWIGYTHYQSPWKPRLAFNLDYASGDGNANCNAPGTGTQFHCTTANTFENLYPTNHIHMGYMDVQSWRNMLSPSGNFQARPTKDDHIEIWYTNLNLANARDNWYRGSQSAYVFSRANNTAKHVGDEVDWTWTHMFADGKVAFQSTYGYLWTGDYIRQNLGNHSNQQWWYLSLWANF